MTQNGNIVVIISTVIKQMAGNVTTPDEQIQIIVNNNDELVKLNTCLGNYFPNVILLRNFIINNKDQIIKPTY
ncbi:MAG: hypothetical protein ACRC92_20565 [Peptostreptococcaceae bacterium]